MNDRILPPFGEWGIAEIVAWPRQGDGTANAKVTWSLAGISAMVNDEPARARAAVQALAAAGLDAMQARLRNREVEGRLERAEAALPPKEPARLLGVGCVREDPLTSSLWLLACAEKGWAAFGYRLDGWDDLFRRFDVVVGVPRTDEHGQWWPAAPRGPKR